jgi:hypothetical protein
MLDAGESAAAALSNLPNAPETNRLDVAPFIGGRRKRIERWSYLPNCWVVGRKIP